MSTAPKMKIRLTGLASGESPPWHGDRLWLADWDERRRGPGGFSIISHMHRLAVGRAPAYRLGPRWAALARRARWGRC